MFYFLVKQLITLLYHLSWEIRFISEVLRLSVRLMGAIAEETDLLFVVLVLKELKLEQRE